MKKSMQRVLSAILLMALAMSVAGCAGKTVYDELGEEGFTVRVRYDAGGAVVNETQNVTIVEVFNEEDVVTIDGKTGVRLLAPDDAARKEGVFKLAKTDGVRNYVQVGWYTERTPRVDEGGRALDAYGEPVEVSGREQDYVYSGKWDFNKNVVEPSMLTDGEITLYAAWIPFFNYEFYSVNETSGAFEKIGEKQKLTLQVPKLNEADGTYRMNDFPKMDGKVFSAAYFDEALTQPLTGNVDGRTMFVDYEKGIATASNVRIYVVWTDPVADAD